MEKCRNAEAEGCLQGKYQHWTEGKRLKWILFDQPFGGGKENHMRNLRVGLPIRVRAGCLAECRDRL